MPMPSSSPTGRCRTARLFSPEAACSTTARWRSVRRTMRPYQLLSANGSLQNGVFVLAPPASRHSARPPWAHRITRPCNCCRRAARCRSGVYRLTTDGIATFRAAATAALGHAATDAEVQSYANGRYQTLVGQVQDYANAQYRQVAPFQLLSANGSLQNGTFVLSAAGVGMFGVAALSAQANATLQLLRANGLVQNGVYALTAAGLAAVASTALNGTDYTTFQQLTASANSFVPGRGLHADAGGHRGVPCGGNNGAGTFGDRCRSADVRQRPVPVTDQFDKNLRQHAVSKSVGGCSDLCGIPNTTISRRKSATMPKRNSRR